MLHNGLLDLPNDTNMMLDEGLVSHVAILGPNRLGQFGQGSQLTGHVDTEYRYRGDCHVMDVETNAQQYLKDGTNTEKLFFTPQAAFFHLICYIYYVPTYVLVRKF